MYNKQFCLNSVSSADEMHSSYNGLCLGQSVVVS